jgi:hypothetical protein
MDLLRKYLLSSVARIPDGVDGAGGSEGGDTSNQGGDTGGNAGGAGQEQPTEFVTLAGDDDEGDAEGVEIDDDEDGEGGEAGEGEDGEGQQQADGANKRKSGSAKWRERARRLEREN